MKKYTGIMICALFAMSVQAGFVATNLTDVPATNVVQSQTNSIDSAAIQTRCNISGGQPYDYKSAGQTFTWSSTDMLTGIGIGVNVAQAGVSYPYTVDCGYRIVIGAIDASYNVTNEVAVIDGTLEASDVRTNEYVYFQFDAPVVLDAGTRYVFYLYQTNWPGVYEQICWGSVNSGGIPGQYTVYQSMDTTQGWPAPTLDTVTAVGFDLQYFMTGIPDPTKKTFIAESITSVPAANVVQSQTNTIASGAIQTRCNISGGQPYDYKSAGQTFIWNSNSELTGIGIGANPDQNASYPYTIDCGYRMVIAAIDSSYNVTNEVAVIDGLLEASDVVAGNYVYFQFNTPVALDNGTRYVFYIYQTEFPGYETIYWGAVNTGGVPGQYTVYQSMDTTQGWPAPTLDTVSPVGFDLQYYMTVADVGITNPPTMNFSVAAGSVTISIGDLSASPSVTNALQTRTDLTSGTWSNLYEVTGVTGTNWTLTTDDPQRFFRVLSTGK